MLYDFELPHDGGTFSDICCGIGGFRIALQNQGYRCVFSSDINPKSKETYFRNYGVVPFDDISRYTSGANALPKPPKWGTRRIRSRNVASDLHIMTGGFPCQPFSRAFDIKRAHRTQEVDCFF